MHKNQEDKHSMQDQEIKERLAHIKNKILVMSGNGDPRSRGKHEWA